MTPDVRLERVVPGARRELFEAWLDPKALARFMTPAQNMSCGKVEVDRRVGGKFLITMILGGRELPHHGVYTEITPHERLAFTWLSHHAGPGSHVHLTFTDAGEGMTRVTLEHYGLAPDKVGPHTQGWTAIVAALAETARPL